MRLHLSAITDNYLPKKTLRNCLLRNGYIVAFIAFMLPQLVSALESDRTQPIEVNADQATLDDKKGLATYRGKVILTQGSLTIKADKLTIKATPNGQIDEVIASGNLAEFTQTPEPNKDPVHAKAKRINYLVTANKMILTGSASIVQNKNLFQGNIITYDIKHQKLTASGPTETQSQGKSSGRVKMILPPPTSTPESITERPQEPAIRATDTTSNTISTKPEQTTDTDE